MKRILILGILINLILAVTLSGCGGSSGGNGGPTTHSHPFTLDSNTTILWHFDEYPGSTTVADSSSTQTYPLTLNGNSLPTFVSGNTGFGSCLSLKGAEAQYASTPGSTTWLTFSSAISVEFWLLYNTSPSGDSELIQSNDPSLEVNIDSNGYIKFLLYNSGGNPQWNTLISTKTLSPKVWHYIACTSDGSNATIYIDGALDSQHTMPFKTSLTKDRGYYVGGPSGGFTGCIDEMRISYCARTATEIASFY